MSLDETVGKIVDDLDIAFTVASDQMIKKLNKYLLSNSFDYVRELLSAEIYKNPSKIHMKANNKRFELVDDGKGYSIDEIDELFSQILFSKESELKKYSGLVNGIISGMNTDAEYVLIESVKDGEKVSYKITSDYEFTKSDETTLKQGTRITVKKKHKRSFSPIQIFRRKSKAHEIKNLKYICHFFDKNISLKINGYPLEDQFPEDNGFKSSFEEKDGSKVRFFMNNNSKAGGVNRTIKLINGLIYEENYENNHSSIEYVTLIDDPNFDLNLSKNKVINFDRTKYTNGSNLMEKAYVNNFYKAKEARNNISKLTPSDEVFKIESNFDSASKEMRNRIRNLNRFDKQNVEFVLDEFVDEKFIPTCDQNYVSIRDIINVLESGKQVFYDTVSNKYYPSDEKLVLLDKPGIKNYNVRSFSETIQHFLDPKTRNVLETEYYGGVLKEQLQKSSSVENLKFHLKRIKREKKLDELLKNVNSLWTHISESPKKEFSDYFNLITSSINFGAHYSVYKPANAVSFGLNRSYNYSAKKLSIVKDVSVKVATVTGLGIMAGLTVAAAGATAVGAGAFSVGAIGLSAITAPFVYVGRLGFKAARSKIVKKTASSIFDTLAYSKYSPIAAMIDKKQTKRDLKYEQSIKRKKLEYDINELFFEVYSDNEGYIDALPTNYSFKAYHPRIEIVDSEKLTSFGFSKKQILTSNQAAGTIDGHTAHNHFYVRDDGEALERWVEYIKLGPEYEYLVKTELFNLIADKAGNNIKWSENQPPETRNAVSNSYNDGSYSNHHVVVIPFVNEMSISEKLAQIQLSEMNNSKLALINDMVEIYKSGSDEKDFKKFEDRYSILKTPDKKILIKTIQSDSLSANETIDSFLDKNDAELVDYVCRTMIGNKKNKLIEKPDNNYQQAVHGLEI